MANGGREQTVNRPLVDRKPRLRADVWPDRVLRNDCQLYCDCMDKDRW